MATPTLTPYTSAVCTGTRKSGRSGAAAICASRTVAGTIEAKTSVPVAQNVSFTHHWGAAAGWFWTERVRTTVREATPNKIAPRCVACDGIGYLLVHKWTDQSENIRNMRGNHSSVLVAKVVGGLSTRHCARGRGRSKWNLLSFTAVSSVIADGEWQSLNLGDDLSSTYEGSY